MNNDAKQNETVRGHERLANWKAKVGQRQEDRLESVAEQIHGCLPQERSSGEQDYQSTCKEYTRMRQGIGPSLSTSPHIQFSPGVSHANWRALGPALWTNLAKFVSLIVVVCCIVCWPVKRSFEDGLSRRQPGGSRRRDPRRTTSKWLPGEGPQRLDTLTTESTDPQSPHPQSAP